MELASNTCPVHNNVQQEEGKKINDHNERKRIVRKEKCNKVECSLSYLIHVGNEIISSYFLRLMNNIFIASRLLQSRGSKNGSLTKSARI